MGGGKTVPRVGDIRALITTLTVDLTGNTEINPEEPLMSAGLDSLAGMGRGLGGDSFLLLQSLSVSISCPLCKLTLLLPRFYTLCDAIRIKSPVNITLLNEQMYAPV